MKKQQDLAKRLEKLEKEVRNIRSLLKQQKETNVLALPDQLDVIVGNVNEEWVSLPLETVQEVIPRVMLTPLPEVPNYIPGYMHWRGAQVPVIDLAARWSGTSLALKLEDRIVVVSFRDQNWGLLLSHVDHLDRIPRDRVETIPPEVPAGPYAAGVWRYADHTVLLLSVEHLIDPFSMVNV